jgi:hypothetical protein
MRSCPDCGHPNSSEAAFCVECGRSLAAGRPCPGCGFTGNLPKAGYCVQCGTSLRRRSFVPFIWLGGLALALVAAVILWQTGLVQEWVADGPTSSAERLPTPTTNFLAGEPAADTPTSSSKSTQAPTATPPSTATQPPTATPPSPSNAQTPTGVGSSGCPDAPPQRVRVGDKARVCTAYDQLVVRARPGRSSSEIARLKPGTYVTIVDGPICADVWSWWKVQTDSGTVGWVAEGGDEIDPYFICPAR